MGDGIMGRFTGGVSSKTAPFIKKTLAWLVVLLGILFGVLALALLGIQGTEDLDNPWRLVAWFALGSVSIAGSCIAMWNPRFAGLMFPVAAAVTVLVRLSNPRRAYIGREAVLILGPLLFFGLFWYFTSFAGWPRLLAGSLTPRRKAALGLLAFLTLSSLVLIGAVLFTIMRPSCLFIDCGRSEPFATQQYKGHAVFTAVVRYPAIAVVKERFWGLPAGWNKVVLVAPWGVGHSTFDGRALFIDGRRADGLITRFLPIVDITHCSRTSPLERAALDVRILRQGPSQKGVRIVGHVRGEGNQLRRGVEVVITGPMGDIPTTTDREGIFDLKDLPPGKYAVHVEECDESKNPTFYRCSESYGSNLKAGDIWEAELRSN